MADPSGSNNCKPRTGGGPDSATRPFIDRLSRLFGQQFIVENRGGASGSLGFKAVVKSPAGGYTFLATPSLSVVIVPHLRKVPFDPLKDLVPVTQFVEETLLVAVQSLRARQLDPGACRLCQTKSR